MIPNLHEVTDSLKRGGEPQFNSDWDELWQGGTRYVIQLDCGDATYPRAIGMIVYQMPLSFWAQFFWPKRSIIRWVKRALLQMDKEGVFIHCQHGADRTGLVVAVWRWTKGWTKKAAFEEAKQYGFSGEAALQGAWDSLPESPSDPW